MSAETTIWLNQNTLIGFTEKRGNAWHYRAESQGEESNHYTGAIPVEDVQRRLFDWTAIELPVIVAIPASMEDMTGVDDKGNPVRHLILQDRKAIAASDNHHVFNIFKSGYVGHDYTEWLLQYVANILDDNLSISSAGLLKQRAVAWVEVSVPDSIKTPEGVEFRPNLLACTSFDGSLATTYKRTVQLTVCDNTMAVALGEHGQQVKVKHSKYSKARISDAREALAVVFDVAESFQAEVARLTRIDVTEAQWASVLDALNPIPTDDGRAKTIASNKRDELEQLYSYDMRVSPWKGTAFGVLQAFNTYNHHIMGVRGAGRTEKELRAERNMLNAIDGSTDKADAIVLDALVAVGAA